ncbi:MAG: hypothetical protein Q9188_004937 [Gyalolechia gomerana]
MTAPLYIFFQNVHFRMIKEAVGPLGIGISIVVFFIAISVTIVPFVLQQRRRKQRQQFSHRNHTVDHATPVKQSPFHGTLRLRKPELVDTRVVELATSSTPELNSRSIYEIDSRSTPEVDAAQIAPFIPQLAPAHLQEMDAHATAALVTHATSEKRAPTSTKGTFGRSKSLPALSGKLGMR